MRVGVLGHGWRLGPLTLQLNRRDPDGALHTRAVLNGQSGHLTFGDFVAFEVHRLTFVLSRGLAAAYHLCNG